MFGNLLGDMEERQKQIKEKLAGIMIETSAGDDAIKITANANREILNISIDKEKLDFDDIEQLEDFLLVSINRALELASNKEAEETKKLINDMMPPGLGDLSGLFG